MVAQTMSSPPIQTLTLTSISKILSHLPQGNPCESPRANKAAADKAVRLALDDNQASALVQFGLGQHPWLILRTGLDLSSLCETPLGFAPVADPSWWQMAWITIGAMSIAGASLVSYKCENDGAAFVNLVALPPNPNQARAVEKSGKKMRGHTDAVAFPFPSEYERGGEPHSPSPDFWVLLGLRNPDNVPTKLAPVSLLLEKLDGEQEEALRGDNFSIGAQRTFQTKFARADAPLLSDAEPLGLAFRFSHSEVAPREDKSPQATAAYGAIIDALPDLYADVPIQPGDICLVNNRTVIHGRGAPGNASGGQTRWLLRTYGYAKGTRGDPIDDASPHIHR